MKIKFDKAYEPQLVEQVWYQRWQQAGCFHADADSTKDPFCIVIPPPNVTGSLHMGHALDNTLQDILIRYRRMRGYNALWMPGMDHAGIATQNVVEKQLESQGLSRETLGREKFVAAVWKWKEEYGGKILTQLQRLGASCDWRRQRFTMDAGLSTAVREVFVELYEEGYIYRGFYIINWCTRCHTALSDLEVEHEELPGRLYTIKYPLADSAKAFIPIATTRPETMLGDTAVAVHPDDKRYQRYIGKQLRLPLVDRLIPVIGDASVKQDFGTGALKITPAHDFNDFEIGKKHQLDSVSVMDEKGQIDCAQTRYHGMTVKGARKAVVADLKQHNLFMNDKAHPHMVGHCSRCESIVEPRVSRQWFVKMQGLAKTAIHAVRQGETEIIPRNWEKVYFDWLENIRDWCISRQLWWGHRIPVWYCEKCDATIVSKTDPKSCNQCSNKKLKQDDDVLDTWFSSALWPFSTLGWPEKTTELKTFYPTSVLVTGFDILFFWVCRMMMLGLKFMNDVPFRQVYLHALVRDSQGQKMTKSKGNVIDPLTLMDEYGTDALRFTLTALAIQGRDMSISHERIKGYRHFVNKLWNASRFVAISFENLRAKVDLTDRAKEPPKATTAADIWINSLLRETINQVNQAYEEMRFSDAAQQLYHFVWHQYCDWYIEMAKSSLIVADGANNEQLERAVATATNLVHTLDTILRLLHPIMPFVTEEIWQKLASLVGTQASDYLMLAPFPELAAAELNSEQQVQCSEIEFIKQVVTAIRTLKSENAIAPSRRVPVTFVDVKTEQAAVLKRHWQYVVNLALLEADPHFQATAAGAQQKGPVASSVVDGMQIVLPLGDLIDVDKERGRLEREISKLKQEWQRLDKKQKDREFLKKAPPEVVETQQKRFVQAEKDLQSLQAFLQRLTDG